jgi:hypothetical protein
MNPVTRRLAPSLLAALVLVAAACSGAAAPSQAPSLASLVPPLASTNPSAGPDDGPTPVPGGATSRPPTDADRAAAVVLATDPRFAGLEASNPDMIGQCCFYTVKSSPDGWLVTVEIGWGDCPAGCISRHRWTFTVDRNGTVTKIAESGPPIPSGEPGGG